MSDTLESPQVYTINNKRNILIALIVIDAVSVISPDLLARFQIAVQIATIATSLAFTVAMLLWCHIDARERNVQIGPGFRILVILTGPIAVIYYLFKSRGLKGGFISLGWMLLFTLSLFFINIVLVVLLSVIKYFLR